MRIAHTLVFLVFVAVFSISCGGSSNESPREILIGEWASEGDTITFFEDGTMISPDGRQSWSVNTEEPYAISVNEGDRKSFEVGMKIISNDELEFTVQGRTWRVTRR